MVPTTAAQYRSFGDSARAKTGQADPLSLQQEISKSELFRGLRMYTGPELSVADDQTSVGQRCFYQVACVPATYTGTSAALNPAPGESLPGMEEKGNLVRRAEAIFASAGNSIFRICSGGRRVTDM